MKPQNKDRPAKPEATAETARPRPTYEQLLARVAELERADATATEERLTYLASFPERNPNPIVEVNAQGRVAYANPAAGRIFPDLRERGLDHPWLAAWAEVSQSMRDRSPGIGQRTVPVGDRVYVQTFQLVPGNQALRIYGLDVTERHRAEESLRRMADELELERSRLRAVVENMEEAVAIWSPEGDLVLLNQATVKLYGFSTKEQMFRHLSDYAEVEVRTLDGREVPHGEWPAARALRGETFTNWVLEYHIPSLGRRFIGSTSGSPVRDGSGKLVLAVNTAHDLTELFDAQRATARSLEERERLLTELREADRRKDQFLAVLSHELRNPLAPIRNSLYILEHAAPTSDHAKRAHGVVERQVTHLARLVDDLLDATRVASGKMQIRRERLELVELVRRAVEDHRALFAAGGVELRASVTTRPAWAQGDPTRLTQVVGNLLQNAAKFTAEGGRVEVSLSVDAGNAVLRLSDTGMGIPPDMLERVFEPFVQTEQALDRHYGGLGLGLALARSIVERHGGEITATSDGPGRGAIFTVRLPIDTSIAPEPTGTSAAQHRQRRVLVIEDNVDAADTLREALELDGHTVVVASDGAQGIEAARRFLPEVVLCDLGLPRMDGYEVARVFRADAALRSAFLVAVTGYALAEDISKAVEAGFDRHLPKPVSVDVLERVLDEARSGRAAAGHR